MKHVQIFENFGGLSKTLPPVLTVEYDFDGITRNGEAPIPPASGIIWPSNYYITFHRNPSPELFKKALNQVDNPHRKYTDQDLEDMLQNNIYSSIYGDDGLSNPEDMIEILASGGHDLNILRNDVMMLILDPSYRLEDYERAIEEVFEDWRANDFEWYAEEVVGDPNQFTNEFVDHCRNLVGDEDMDGLGQGRYQYSFKVV